MLDNLKQSGVFVFHGSDDRTVSPEQARLMRKLLGEFHSDFTYYEFPGGGHWFGTESMDWPPIFDYFRLHTIPKQNDVREIDFTTASPGISASDYWLRVEQQVTPCEFTNIIAVRDADTIFVEKTDNAALLVFDLPALDFASNTVRIDIGEQQIPVPAGEKAYLAFDGKEWKTVSGVDTKQRYSGRYGGGFKFAFDHNVVLVYATGGTPVENELYLNKARYDAETFYYRGNGSFDVIPDTEFTLEKYAGRNVVVYGNRNNNRAWNLLLKNSPIQVSKDAVTAGAQSWKGDDLGAYFLYPHPQNDVNFVGVVAGTGETGIRGASLNNYLQPITGFPEIMIFRADMLRTGLDGLEHAGFYNNNWEL
jgi:hypothetical protein